MEYTIEHIKIYKNFYKTGEISQLVNNCELSLYTLRNFDRYYDCLTKLDNIKRWCGECGIESLKDYVNILNTNIRDKVELFNDRRLANLRMCDIGVSTDNIFVPLEPGRKYLSIDMTHAYAQYVDSLNIFDTPLDDMLFDGLPDFFKESKKVRLMMYCQIPSKDETKYNIIKMLTDILKSDCELIHRVNEYNLKPISYNVDELVFDITECPDMFDDFIGSMNIDGKDVKVDTFEQRYVVYVDPYTSKEKRLSIREYSSSTVFVNNICPYMNQIYKAYNGLSVSEEDLYLPDSTDWRKYHRLPEPIKIKEIL